jgi:hypothetical protein
MELFCPNCQQKLNIPDQYAGQLMRCPLCNGTFQAPALPPANAPEMPAVPVPAAPVPSSPPPAPASPAITAEPTRGAPPPPPPDYVPVMPVSVMEEPRGPARDYIRCCACTFKLPVVTWIAPGALLLVFVFSFLPWVSGGSFAALFPELERISANPWTLGFGRGGDPLFGIFDILMVLTLAASIPSALMTIGIIPIPRGFRLWRAVILTSLVGLAFLFFSIRFIDGVFRSAPTTLWYKLSWRLVFLATLSSAMEIWLELRRARNLPPPKIEMYR